MKHFKKVRLAAFISALFLLTSIVISCGHDGNGKRGCDKGDKKKCSSCSKKCGKKACDKATKKAIAVIQATAGNNVSGTIIFQQENEVINITGNITGLNPGQKHGIHVHEFGDISAEDASSAGGHYNPKDVKHSLVDSSERHLGDLGNLQADAQGNASLNLSLSNRLLCHKKSVIGRAVIIHEKEDDGGQPTGNAGARIGAGVIGVAK